MKLFIATMAALLMSVSFAQAELVQVEISAEVEYNQVGFGGFGDVNAGDQVSYVFQVDSDVFMDSDSVPKRKMDSSGQRAWFDSATCFSTEACSAAC